MKRTLLVSILALVVLGAPSCSKGDGGPSDTSTDDGSGCETAACTSHDECDDGIDCTRDTCVVGGCCEYEPDDGLCAGGEVCDPERGCVATECTSDADCDDGLDCTTDTCLFDHTCAHTDTCPDGQHCEATGCVDDPGDCTSDEDCANGVFCDGDEWCDPEFGCRPPEHARECVDSDPCTRDECDTDADMCTFTCDATLPGCSDACPWDPYPGCFQLDRTIQQRCALGYVDYNFNQVCFDLVGLSLQCTAGSMTLTEVLSGLPPPISFDVTATVAGDCDEYYNIRGTFSDQDHFTATWTATFSGGLSCTISGCVNQSIPVSGTRI